MRRYGNYRSRRRKGFRNLNEKATEQIMHKEGKEIAKSLGWLKITKAERKKLSIIDEQIKQMKLIAERSRASDSTEYRAAMVNLINAEEARNKILEKARGREK